ncbi:MAG: hypothetical protein C0506_03045 [Anaerolinea sp.]|nr:hypothetical protein [Anaerolinea sp.]
MSRDLVGGPPLFTRIATKSTAGTSDNQSVMGFLRKTSPHRRVEQLIRQGVGIHEASWALPETGAGEAPAELVSEIVSWVRRSMGEMRRPYGIDHVAFALACRDGEGKVLCSNSLGVIRPEVFYSEEGNARVAAFFQDVHAVRERNPGDIVGALLSLGDLAYEMEAAHAA